MVRHMLGDRTSPRGTICIARKAEGPTPVGELAEGAFERFTLRVLALSKPGTADGQIYFKAQFRIMPHHSAEDGKYGWRFIDSRPGRGAGSAGQECSLSTKQLRGPAATRSPNAAARRLPSESCRP